MAVAHAVLGNSQRLDGGSMFGNVPRALWSRWCAPDDQGRIGLACRALLIDEGDRKVLLETGIGAFFEPKLKDRFGVVEAEHVLLESLAALGCSDADIDFVILSHLHFDHAGGLLAPYQKGVEPELLFPNAKFVVGETALARARQPHKRDRASFIGDVQRLLDASGRLRVVPDDADTLEELGERYRFRRSFGHTPGMLHTWVRGESKNLFFCADLVPGAPWVHLPVTMGYDRYPEQLIDEKEALYADLTRESPETWLVFTHDEKAAAARLTQDDRGRWSARDAVANFGAQGLSLD